MWGNIHRFKMLKNITTKTSPEKILKLFREAKANDQINLATSNGFIYLTGGILSKIENNKHSIAINNKWVRV